jgi:hypothetical protein
VEVLENEERTVEDKVTAFEMLIELAAQIDNANSTLCQSINPIDVAKMGLWSRIMPFLESNEYELQVHATWLMAVCAQNNQEGAEHLLSLGTVSKMLAMISADEKGPLTKKCVSVLSALFQCSENGYEQFEKQDGLVIFQQATTRFNTDENLRTRIVFSLYFYAHMHGRCPESLRSNQFFYPLVEEELSKLPLE